MDTVKVTEGYKVDCKINLQCILIIFLTFIMSLNQFIIIRIINSLSTDFRVSINPSQSTMLLSRFRLVKQRLLIL